MKDIAVHDFNIRKGDKILTWMTYRKVMKVGEPFYQKNAGQLVKEITVGSSYTHSGTLTYFLYEEGMSTSEVDAYLHEGQFENIIVYVGKSGTIGRVEPTKIVFEDTDKEKAHAEAMRAKLKSYGGQVFKDSELYKQYQWKKLEE